MKKKSRLVLIDGHSVVFRAYYAFSYLTSPDGSQTNAVYGFSLILLNVIEELEPTHIVVAFDMAAPTFRHTDFAGYKAQRKETPSELTEQMPKIKEVVEALNIPIFGVEGYEADDVIGTLAKQASKLQSRKVAKLQGSKVAEFETVIVTGDHDALQLVNDPSTDSTSSLQANSGQVAIKVWMPGRRNKPAVMYGEGQVEKKMGVRPDQVVDLKGLAGDSSDNIPGIKGVGPKTAVELLKKYESIEGIYEAISKKKMKGVSESVIKKLAEGHEMAIKSQKLATIVLDVPIKLDLEACVVHGYDKNKTLELFGGLGFKSLMSKLPDDEFEKDVQEALF